MLLLKNLQALFGDFYDKFLDAFASKNTQATPITVKKDHPVVDAARRIC